MSIIFNTDFDDDKYNKINKGLTMPIIENGDPKAYLKVSFSNSAETLRVFLGDPKSPNNLLAPLYDTGGKLLFPYTPAVRLENQVKYNQNRFVHSVYEQQTYTNATVESFTIDATFTAQTNYEAKYLLAAIHFFRIMSKSQFGGGIGPKNTERVSNLASTNLTMLPKLRNLQQNPLPDQVLLSTDSSLKPYEDGPIPRNRYNAMTPPILSFNYLGKLLFKDVPLVITSVSYEFPPDVDYVPVRTNRLETDYVPSRMKFIITLRVQYNPMRIKQEYDVSAMKDARYLEGIRQGYL